MDWALVCLALMLWFFGPRVLTALAVAALPPHLLP